MSALSHNGKGTKALDPTKYQTTVGGELVLVSSLTLEQALQAVCEAYDVIEDFDHMTRGMQATLESWREK